MDLTNLNNLKNMSIYTYIGIFSILFATVIAPKIKDTLGQVLNNNLYIFIIFLIIANVGKRDLMSGIVCALSFFIIYQNVTEKKIIDIISEKTQSLLESQPVIINEVSQPVIINEVSQPVIINEVSQPNVIYSSSEPSSELDDEQSSESNDELDDEQSSESNDELDDEQSSESNDELDDESSPVSSNKPNNF
jgi:hypothetical protein